MDVSGWSSTPARGPQDGPNVHHGLSFDVTITYFCIQPGFTDETISVLQSEVTDCLIAVFIHFVINFPYSCLFIYLYVSNPSSKFTFPNFSYDFKNLVFF
jgi:hypothetical protein